MARAKVRLQYIENYNARKVSYQKRIKGLVKKAQELSILCGVDVCIVVYGPYDPCPVVWPSSEPDARRILSGYKIKPDMDRTPRKLDQEGYLKQSMIKSLEKLARLRRRNLEIDMENLMSDLLNGKPIEQVPFGILKDLMWVIDDKLRTVQHRFRNIEGPNYASNPGVNHALNLGNSFGNEMMDGLNTVLGPNGSGIVPFQFQAIPTSLSQFQAGPSGPSQFQAGSSQYQHQPCTNTNTDAGTLYRRV